ncbi:PEGA domain-containing protein [Lichenibacterium ramalinae]|uniref:PEGA domain-containing protein n=1 Tax=Lichenibacterium ramalinae TaxID=2316527 RepID=A0A4Q2RCP3_9HYPH|nr:PEGA domain-containing protein [Lichenibacterium ramalinae]RYB02854.1 PEGA domain-containing protein [Lichenibacterium ramalinae]
MTSPRALMLVAALSLAGCATLDHGTLDDVPVVTDPPGANVVATTGTTCTSPCTVAGPRRDNFGITISKPGYATQTLTSEAQPNADAIAKASRLAATSDALGRVIDVQDGAFYTHVPKAVVVKLDPAS